MDKKCVWEISKRDKMKKYKGIIMMLMNDKHTEQKLAWGNRLWRAGRAPESKC